MNNINNSDQSSLPQPAPPVAADLSAAQLIALRQIVAGNGVPRAAAAAGVSRATVYRWMQQGSAFHKVLNHERRAVCLPAAMEILGIMSLASLSVELEVGSGEIGPSLQVAALTERFGRLEKVEAAPASDVPAARG